MSENKPGPKPREDRQTVKTIVTSVRLSPEQDRYYDETYGGVRQFLNLFWKSRKSYRIEEEETESE